MYIYIYLYMYVYICTYICVNIYICIYTHSHLYAYAHIYIHIHTHTHTYTYIHKCLCTCICHILRRHIVSRQHPQELILIAQCTSKLFSHRPALYPHLTYSEYIYSDVQFLGVIFLFCSIHVQTSIRTPLSSV